MEKRYQVFVSSTFRDLEVERQEVMHALLELNCMPAGMELFPAANEDQWNLIKKVIDDCDYYILIVAGRYGSIGPTGVSYTEMEYDYAIETGTPTIAFLHKDLDEIKSGDSEQTDAGKKQLDAFRAKVEKKLCKFYRSPEDLGGVVSRSIVRLMNSTPAIGWVRANEISSKDANIELLNLRRKVEELTADLARTRTDAPQGTENLAQGTDKLFLHFKYEARLEEEFSIEEFADYLEFDWNTIFAVLSPLMIHEAKEADIYTGINKFLDQAAESLLQVPEGYSQQSIKKCRLIQEDFNLIKIQLRALGLIMKSGRTRSVTDSQTYWTLTPYGDNVMTKLLAVTKDDPQIVFPKDTQSNA